MLITSVYRFQQSPLLRRAAILPQPAISRKGILSCQIAWSASFSESLMVNPQRLSERGRFDFALGLASHQLHEVYAMDGR